MRSFIGGWWDRQRPTLQIAGQLRAIGELKGKAELYEHQAPQMLETLRQTAMIQSVESSNRIEGIVIPDQRLYKLVKEQDTPRTRSEAEIAGYRDVLNIIHASAPSIPVRPNVILQLHRDLFSQTDLPGGRWKDSDNAIVERRADSTIFTRFTPVSAFATAEAMEALCTGYGSLSGTIEPLLLIPTFVLDFLCIHPFLDGNGRIARLLTLLQLYQHGYNVGRFISLERVIERSRETYYEALYASSQGWHEGQHDPTPWWSYWLGSVLSAYREFEERAGILTTRRGAKTGLVLDAIDRLHTDFTIRELQRVVPDVGIDWLRQILRQQRDAGYVICLGRGANARWRKVVDRKPDVEYIGTVPSK
jgi:Fic family protein